MASSIDSQKLASMVKSKRGKLGLRVAAKEIQISAPTLSRIEKGQLPDIETYMKICKWLQVSSDFFMESKTEDSTRLKVTASLRADKTLPQETLNALINMINLAYDQVKNGD
jgi:transcriptional regulator with XRE-family HTH domain